jgi:cardiolipin synthase
MDSTQANRYTLHNNVQLIRGGAPYFDALVQIAGNAKHSLHFQTYIFDEDETGRRVADALCAAAQRGVQVYLMVDGYASQRLSAHFQQQLHTAGVHFRFFEPVFFTYKYYLGRRMHHKVLVADAYTGLVGGVNVSNRYNDLPDQPAWLDWAIMTTGDAAATLHKVCTRMWQRTVFRKPLCLPVSIPPTPPPKHICKVRVSRNDWVFRRTDISASYRDMFTKAQHHATVMSSYFWPPSRLLRRIEVAARRGVNVTVILAGHADVPLAKYAERYLYRRLFRAGIDVYEYQPGVLHAKIAFRDDEWTTIGSYNVNNISAFASIELNLDVEDTNTATELRNAIEQIKRNDCRRVIPDDYQLSSTPLRMFQYYCAYLLVQFIFHLFTFYFTQVDGKRNLHQA